MPKGKDILLIKEGGQAHTAHSAALTRCSPTSGRDWGNIATWKSPKQFPHGTDEGVDVFFVFHPPSPAFQFGRISTVALQATFSCIFATELPEMIRLQPPIQARGSGVFEMLDSLGW